MIDFMMANATALTIGAYLVLAAFLALLIAAEGERYKQRWNGANARQGLCKHLGKGMRRLGRALGRFRP